MKKAILFVLFVSAVCASTFAQSGQHRQRFRREAFQTKMPMVHDPVMAKEGDTYYLYATGMGIQQMTSKNRKTWTVLPHPVMSVIPSWTTDSVPGFGSHVWAPDIIQWHGRWWMAYSCSTFGRNGSAIGLLSSRSLAFGIWKDEGCIVTSHNWKKSADGMMAGDNWNAIDPNFIIDEQDTPWLVWGSFWDGIQLARLDSTMHLASKPVTIARRHRPGDPSAAENPTSRFAGRNAIEAPFIFKHGGYYYLFVSWDYCCRGAKSNYRVAVGRSKSVNGPYLDREGKDLLVGGGTLILEGDKKQWEAAGHCAAYNFEGEEIFICHGYSTKKNGVAMLIQRSIDWTADGWPELREMVSVSEKGEEPAIGNGDLKAVVDNVVFRQQGLWINNGDRRIFGVLHQPGQAKGKMPLAIISHGFNGTYHFGQNYFEALAELGYQTFAFDFPCGSVYSRSDNNTMEMSVLDEKNDLKAIVDYFRKQPDVDASNIVLIGESQGGLVTALTAAEMSRRISQVVLVYPALCIPDNWRAHYPDGAVIPDTTRMWNVPLGRRYFEEVRPMQVFDKITAYKGPVLIVQGDKDHVVSMADSEHAVKLYRDARLHVIPGAGHGFKPDEMEEAIRQIKSFLMEHGK